MTTSMNLGADDQMELISEFYPELYTKMVPQQGEAKPRRRRRKKSKGEDGGGGGGGGGFKKRKLSEQQVNMLELSFGKEHKLESERKDRLASELGLDPRQVAVWFQNRRARWKSKKIEEQFSKLKMEHDSTVVDKCRLETEVLKLKERLCDADKEIQRLLERCTDGVSSNSPSTSFSVEAMEPVPAFLGEFGMDGIENIFHFSDNNYVQVMEWANPLYI